MQEIKPPPNRANDSIHTITTYVLLTAVFLLCLIFITHQLARQPRYLTLSNVSLPPQWEAITNDRQTFTFNLPPNWTAIELQEDNLTPLTKVAEDKEAVIDAALSFIRQIDPSTEIQLIASPNTDEIDALLLITVSERMSSLKPEALVTAVQNEVPDLFLAETAQLPGGQTFANIVVDYLNDSNSFRCSYRYAHNEMGGFFFVGCLPRNQFGRLSSDLSSIQTSFQLLTN